MKLTNVECKWCKVQEPDTMYAPKWCVDVYPPKAVLTKLKKDKFNVKTDKEGNEFVHVKQNVTRKDGTKNDPPKIVGRDGRTVFKELIGNGSIVNVMCYDYEYKGKNYLGLKALQVVKHVPYGEDNSFDNLEEEKGEEESLFEDVNEGEEY